MKRASVRVLVLVLQIVVSAELTLQVLGLTEPWWSSRAGSRSADAERHTILCVGDSHTYGAPLPEAESYPAQLQGRLDARSPGRYRVVNLGIPGINSAMVAHRFRDNLVRYRPDLVILWVGANNIWNEKETETWDAGGPPAGCAAPYSGSSWCACSCSSAAALPRPEAGARSS